MTNTTTVRIGAMPGRINEFALLEGTSLQEAIAIAELSTEGYDVKVDGQVISDLSTPVGAANLILLTQKVKGN